MLGIHFRRATEIVVATNNVKRHECHSTHRPTKVLPELAKLRVGGLANDGYRALAEAPSVGKKHGAQFRKTLQGVKLARLYTMTVSPIVITGRQNERMPDGLKGIVDSLETFVGTRHRSNGRVASVCSTVIFEVANVDYK
jgi:hypothetical protein